MVGGPRDTLVPYRPALDGVRAVAVIAVVGYHLGWRWLPGGFLGVDVFFVLSGYLITTILLAEHGSRQTIDVVRFWIRRARRLLPALFVVVAACAVWVGITSTVYELPQRRGDLLATIFYFSNWHLIATSQDYFAQFSGVSIMRHTWSLAIEEQFYLVWPAIVLATLRLTRRHARSLGLVAAAGAVVSLVAMAALYVPGDPSRAYYGTDARLHQLLIGAVLAVWMRSGRRAGRTPVSTGVSVAATLGLLAAFVAARETWSWYYRGGSAVVAIDAAALIWAVEAAPMAGLARLLASPPFRALGRISYGVYLWHWPIIMAATAPAAVFAWLPGKAGLDVSRIVLTLLVATLSFTLIEEPIRRSRVRVLSGPAWRPALATGLALMVVVWLSTVLTTVSGAMAAPGSDHGGARLDAIGCELRVCVRVRGGPGAPVVAVIGDSVARSLDPGLASLARSRGWTYITAASDGCRITHLWSRFEGGSDRYRPCYQREQGVLSRMLSDWKPDVVVALDWFELQAFVGSDGAVVRPGTTAWLEAEREQLRSLAATFAPVTRIVFVPPPPVVHPRSCFRVHADAACVVPAADDAVAGLFDEGLRSVVAGFPGRADVVSLTPVICPDARCPLSLHGVLIRYDGIHFTTAASRWLVPVLFREIERRGLLAPSAA
jgi:peptidoglycan/LPS O-acetylase OafA/YrhL